ncbi:hypothetical protein LshimejAT787_0806540 [Lyophyllum shimeji]|uniref:Uncharacterized protein n=1 Tax=Lyophyllum shimeji TaxID=47721 RepID=A0A9P3PRN5_LYOSH|nr:hypothetical protein LshimejAT787_0806540 [Lyophyllum shimeji]
MEEEEAWKKTSYTYDAYAKRLRTSLEKRRAALAASSSLSSTTVPPAPPSSTAPPLEGTSPSPSTPSAKARGKQPEQLQLREHELPPAFQPGVRMARRVFAQSCARGRRRPGSWLLPAASSDAGPSTSNRKGADPDSRPLPTSHSSSYDMKVEVEVEMEEQEAVEKARASLEAFRARMGEVEWKVDQMYVLASQMRAAAEAAEAMLDERFEVLGRALDARDTPLHLPLPADGGGGGGVGVGFSGGTSPAPRQEEWEKERRREKADEAWRLLRALARVDAARPPAQVGDAARRAVREAQRVGRVVGLGWWVNGG